VIGSGEKRQTYLYWRDDQLFQLPAGYSTVFDRSINSPGYKDGVADFGRGIIPRCLECHATYFQPAFPGRRSAAIGSKSILEKRCNDLAGSEPRPRKSHRSSH
jgi:hypothetical protein